MSLAVVICAYLGIQSLLIKDEYSDSVSITDKVSAELAQTKIITETSSQDQLFDYIDEQKGGVAVSIFPSAHASTIETLEHTRADDIVLGTIFDAEYAPIMDESGVFSGFLVSSLSDELLSDVATEAKLLNGDIVTQINNVQLDSEESLALAIAQLFQNQENAIITFGIVRNGIDQSVSFQYQP